MRAQEWRGELADPASWPTALRNALRLCFANGAPTQVWWGRSLHVFYNDAAIPLIEGHPGALGCTVSEVSGERWGSIRAATDRVFETGHTVEHESHRLVPVFDDTGAVAGIVCISPLPARPELFEPITTLATQLLTPLTKALETIDDMSTTSDETVAVPRDQLEGMLRLAAQLNDQVLALPGEISAARNEARRVLQKSKDDFLALVGHELRNPLSTISTMLQALMMRGSSSEVELMWRGVRQLTRLVEDLLESSRLSRGAVDLQPRAVELAHIVDRAMELASPWFEDKRTKVTVNVPRTAWRVEVDPERIARAVSNVLMNASQHSTSGTPIVVDVVRVGDKVGLRVADRGSGIESEKLPVVFTSFQSQPREGSLGLGLAIARSIVELHHGSIVVKSEGAGRGTECIIELRATSAPAVETAATATTATRKRLLLVEDNDDAARALKSALEQLGYEVALAHDAPIAINLARTFQPDVALLDLGLPIMDGWELAKRLRGAASELPIVAVTARDQEADKQRSAELGFAEHLVKPINLTELQRIVQQLSTH